MKFSLRVKLLFSFFLISLLFLFFTLFTSFIVRKKISSQIKDFQSAIIKSSQKMVEHYVLNCERALLNLSGDKNFKKLVKDEKRNSLRRVLKRVFRKYKTYSFLCVLKRKGRNIKGISFWPYSYEGILKNKNFLNFVLSGFKYPRVKLSRVTGFRNKKEIFVLIPMRGAVLVGGINLENLKNLLKKVKPIEKSEFWILDVDKKFIIGGGTRFEYDIEKEGFIELRVKNIFASYIFSKMLNWYIVLSSSWNEIYSGVIGLKRITVLFTILGIIIAFFLSFYFSKKITSPIWQLNKGARILASGNLSYRINLKTGDELEKLALEFNRMAEELKKSYDSLDEKIRNATKDLKEAYIEIEDKNRRLEEADKLKSEFLANMSHELRTPLNAIIGFTDLIKEGVYGKVNKNQYDKLDRIHRNANHLLNLINDILDLSKIEAGKMELYPEKFDLSSLIYEIKEEMEPLAKERGLDFITETDNIDVYLDYRRLKQIVLNLVSNAIKFTKQGYVKIRTYQDEDNFYIEVEDTGIGIKEEKIEHIFEEFRQIDGSTTREFGGTGLGLSITKKLTELMKGKIEVKSEIDKGSVFRLIFPRTKKEEK